MSAAPASERRSFETAMSPRLLAGLRSHRASVSLEDHLRLHGPLPAVSGRHERRDLIALVEEAGLTGRGGAAFPTARKLAAVSGRKQPVVVANGTEGEPASGKDKVLLVYTPHLVIDGAVLAARAVGAREAIIATTSATADVSLARALGERRDRGVSIRRVRVPASFVVGEETALVQYLNGGPPLPTFTPPRPFERGVRGAPTLVQNVETLAHLALIARHGSEWFREIGTPAEPGSALVTISGAVRAPGVHEIPIGLPLSSLLELAGGITEEPQAFLVGGYFGTWVAAADAVGLRLANADVPLGARAIVALGHGACGIAETAAAARYLADESAGQCGPCVHGLAAVADDLERLTGRDRVDAGRLRNRLALIAGRGACRHPDGAVKFVASALDVFSAELERHLGGRGCTRRAHVLPLPHPAR